MIKQLLKPLIGLLTGLIATYGSLAVVLLMALESANIPIPSEVILTYAGFLASRGQFNWHLIALAGAIGCLLGGSLSYYLGLRLGRPFIYKHGKWLLLSPTDLARAEKFLTRYGELTYFFSRLLPVVRTFIAFPVGMSRGNFWRFSLYGFLGSWLWSYFLVYLGVKLGDNWETIRPYWDRFSLLVVILILTGILSHIYRVFRSKAESLPLNDCINNENGLSK